MERPRITLTIGETDWLGWTSVTVVSTIDAVAGSFSISLTELWPGITAPRAITPGEPCVLSLDGAPVITGYIDVVSPFYSATEHAITIEGRDKTSDLVDCSAHEGQWANLPLVRLAEQIAAPFGISVVSEVGDGPSVKQFKINPGDTAWASLDRAFKAAGVLGMSDGRGNLVITRAKTSDAKPIAVILGSIPGRPPGNVLKATGTYRADERFSTYRLIGQAGGLAGTPEERAHVEAFASDPGARDARYKLVRPVDRTDAATGKTQVNWEANTAAGRATRASYTFAGWNDSNGNVWRPNTIVKVTDDFLRLDRELLVATVQLVMRVDAFEADIDLADPRTYLPEPIADAEPASTPATKKKSAASPPKTDKSIDWW